MPGDSSGGATPVSIPNTEVKPSSADGTARETVWESRSSPGTFFALDFGILANARVLRKGLTIEAKEFKICELFGRPSRAWSLKTK